MQESAAGSFWARREAQASLGKDNGLQPFTTKVFYAAVSIVLQYNMCLKYVFNNMPLGGKRPEVGFI